MTLTVRLTDIPSSCAKAYATPHTDEYDSLDRCLRL
eukprot:CAMPEP_0114520140 /NCGR_PEP_ID=MMETSP0109-20121206/19405_1 /TAXON_ID=29199 /ORGANISM="Chlorarachnion reptans, Strain CCCM449" /LENGTH=35 /DNA_ID= /DNA_START= /DNA_END= /DNA_ORIENTATION=